MAINFAEGDMVNINDQYGRSITGKVIYIKDPLFPDSKKEAGKKKVCIRLSSNKQFIEYFKLVDEFDFITKAK